MRSRGDGRASDPGAAATTTSKRISSHSISIKSSTNIAAITARSLPSQNSDRPRPQSGSSRDVACATGHISHSLNRHHRHQRRAGWLMSAGIVANETAAKGKPWWHHQFGPAEIPLPVASHQPEPRRDRLHRTNASAFATPLGLSVSFRPALSSSSRPTHSSATTTITPPLLAATRFIFSLAFVGSVRANITYIAGLLPSLIGLHLASIIVVCCMIPP